MPSIAGRTPIYWLIIGLTILHLVPIWAFKYIPTQDGPAHIENSYMLLHYLDQDRAYNRYYQLNLTPFPNWFSHGAMALLMILFSPLTAEKVLLSLYIIVFVLSLTYFLKSVGEDKLFFTLLAFPFIYNYPLQMGFYNFCFSVPLMLLLIGYWWRRRGEGIRLQFIFKLNLLLIFLYFFHIISQLLAILAIILLAFLHHRTKLSQALALSLGLIPAALPALYFLYTRGIPYPGRWSDLGLLSYFARAGALVSYDWREYYLGGLLGALFAGFTLFTLAGKKGYVAEGPRVFKLRSRDGFFILSLIFFLIYFFTPVDTVEGQYLTCRLSIYPFMIILPWFNAHLGKSAKSIVVAITSGLILTHLGFTAYHYRILNAGLEEYTSGIPFVGKNQTILPINLDYPEKAQSPVMPYEHAVGYYCVFAGAIELYNYEANRNHFPLKYRPSLNPFKAIKGINKKGAAIYPQEYPEPIDYILLWNPDRQFPALEWLQRHYYLLHSQGRLRLYKRG